MKRYPDKMSVGLATQHESARGHVSGTATYIDDIPTLKGTLYAAPVISTVACGRLLSCDSSAAMATLGVRAVVFACDVPGDPVFATFSHDEEILPSSEISYLGQVVGLVVADDVETARRAARMVKLVIDVSEPILSIASAIKAKSFVMDPVTIRRGEPDAAMATAARTVKGKLEAGGQEHFYLEGQIAYAIPLEKGHWHVHSSTQHPHEVQHWISHALGLPNNAIRVECRRMGGAFGGKETQAGHMAVWATLAAHKVKRPVKLRLERTDDFMITGKRHPFAYEWEVGFEENGRIVAAKLVLASNCGFSADLSGPVADRAMMHCDNAYFIEHLHITSYRCKTNTQSHTAFRGFGGPQGMLLIEAIMGDIGRELNVDPLDVRKVNFYGDGARGVTHYGMEIEDNILHPLVAKLEETSGYRRRRGAIEAWNTNSHTIKRGLSITPVKFGISYTAIFMNQAGALVHVYLDGSVQVTHGGTEMGQGLHTKVAQVVADTLGVSFDTVSVVSSDTSKVPNASATAASSGADLNGEAAKAAANAIRTRLCEFVVSREGCAPDEVLFQNGWISTPARRFSFQELVQDAYKARLQLWSDGFYKTPKVHFDKKKMTGRPFYYFAYGAACAEVAIDTLTGECRVLAVDILHDVGDSLNPAIDRGQVEGGFVQGVGWLTTEELCWSDTGRLLSNSPSTYKIPTAWDVPKDFQVDFWPEPNREDNLFGSKAVGEPPFMLAICVYEAIKDAVAASRAGAVSLTAPATPENILRAINMPSAHSSATSNRESAAM